MCAGDLYQQPPEAMAGRGLGAWLLPGVQGTDSPLPYTQRFCKGFCFLRDWWDGNTLLGWASQEGKKTEQTHTRYPWGTGSRGRSAPHSGLHCGGGSVGLEALVGPLVCEQPQGHGVHSRLQPRLLGDLHCVVIGL